MLVIGKEIFSIKDFKINDNININYIVGEEDKLIRFVSV